MHRSLCVLQAGGMHSWRWYLSRVMRLFLRWFRLCPQRGRRKRQSRVRDLWNYGKVVLKSLYYNIQTNSDTVLDCAFEPIYWLVDNLTRWFGVVSRLISVNIQCIFFRAQNVFIPTVLYTHSFICFLREGVCIFGDLLDQLCRDYRLSLCASRHLEHVPLALDTMAPLLRALESTYAGLPLLQSHNHTSGRSPAGGDYVRFCSFF